MVANKKWTIGISLPQTTTSDLRGRQSVRATFKLTEECIGAISIVATHLGIKQKSLFDHLVEDMNSLKAIARGLKNTNVRTQNRVQKTFVISRKSLRSLETVSKSHNAPRDALVEFSVQRLLPIIIKEQKRHQARKKMRREIETHFEAGNALLSRVKNVLGTEDPVLSKMTTLMMNYNSTFAAIDAFIERGRLIEEFDPEMLKQMIETL
ncbi:MAG: hypothetical protein JRI64_01105 [Deltaproteobacteria bacterium]|nr:hypothetical protein [Deltaproteobacteria bacterium]